MASPYLSCVFSFHPEGGFAWKYRTVAKAEFTGVIPSSLVETVLKLLQDTVHAGHHGRDRALPMACTTYYELTMPLDIARHFAQCLSCAETKDAFRRCIRISTFCSCIILYTLGGFVFYMKITNNKLRTRNKTESYKLRYNAITALYIDSDDCNPCWRESRLAGGRLVSLVPLPSALLLSAIPK